MLDRFLNWFTCALLVVAVLLPVALAFAPLAYVV